MLRNGGYCARDNDNYRQVLHRDIGACEFCLLAKIG
jgi:hypothetical protein